MLVLSEENNKLVISFEGLEDYHILDEYNEEYLNSLYVSYKDKVLVLDNSVFSCYISDFDDECVFVNIDTFNNLELLKEFINKVKNMEIVIKVNDTERVFNFISSLDEDEIDNVYINYQFNSDVASVKDYKNMISKINSLVHTIKSLNLSELETVMVVYDIVKANEYKKKSFDDPSLTRAVHNVVLGDGCVCAGFSNYFNFLLNEFGIKSYPVILNHDNRDSRHQRSIMYINDDKYGVNGIYMFDPTYDCKKNDNYVNNYDYFLQSVSYFKDCFVNEYIDASSLGNYDVYGLFDMDDNDIDNMELIDYGNLNKTISYLNRMCGKKNDYFSMFDLEKIKKSIGFYKELMSNDVDYDVFVDLLFNVKMVEGEMGFVSDCSFDEVRDVVYKRYRSMYIRHKDLLGLLFLKLDFDHSDLLFNDEMIKKIKK